MLLGLWRQRHSGIILGLIVLQSAQLYARGDAGRNRMTNVARVDVIVAHRASFYAILGFPSARFSQTKQYPALPTLRHEPQDMRLTA